MLVSTVLIVLASFVLAFLQALMAWFAYDRYVAPSHVTDAHTWPGWYWGLSALFLLSWAGFSVRTVWVMDVWCRPDAWRKTPRAFEKCNRWAQVSAAFSLSVSFVFLLQLLGEAMSSHLDAYAPEKILVILALHLCALLIHTGLYVSFGAT